MVQTSPDRAAHAETGSGGFLKTARALQTVAHQGVGWAAVLRRRSNMEAGDVTFC